MPARPIGDRPLGRAMMFVLWPAFLMSAVAEGVFFSMIDPHELVVVGLHLADSREAAYTVAFFVFWALFTACSALTYLMVTTTHPPPPLRVEPQDRGHQDKAPGGR